MRLSWGQGTLEGSGVYEEASGSAMTYFYIMNNYLMCAS